MPMLRTDVLYEYLSDLSTATFPEACSWSTVRMATFLDVFFWELSYVNVPTISLKSYSMNVANRTLLRRIIFVLIFGRTHSVIVRLQTRIRRKDGSERFRGFVYVWDGSPQRDFVLWVFMYPNNITLFFDSIFLPLPRVFSVSLLRLPRQGLPRPIYVARAITPSPLHGYHACVFTSLLPRHSSEFHFWVITPELSRFTTHVNRVITAALVSSS